MGTGGGGEQIIRYAPYLEEAHQKFLGAGSTDAKLIGQFNAALDQSPYGDYVTPVVDDIFFGSGSTISDLPVLNDIFVEFMSGVDVRSLWGEIYGDLVRGPEIAASIAAHSALMQDEIDSTIMPKFLAGMRDINSVMGSSFVIGKAIIMDGHTKAVNQYASELRLKATADTAKLLVQKLDWNKSVVMVYSEFIKLYYSLKNDVNKVELEYRAKDILWNLNLFDYARSMIGALNGAAAAKSDKEPSMLQKVLGGALSGAGAGAMLGPWGALGGGLLGLASGFM
jgi:hypothetical protein